MRGPRKHFCVLLVFLPFELLRMVMESLSESVTDLLEFLEMRMASDGLIWCHLPVVREGEPIVVRVSLVLDYAN